MSHDMDVEDVDVQMEALRQKEIELQIKKNPAYLLHEGQRGDQAGAVTAAGQVSGNLRRKFPTLDGKIGEHMQRITPRDLKKASEEGWPRIIFNAGTYNEITQNPSNGGGAKGDFRDYARIAIRSAGIFNLEYELKYHEGAYKYLKLQHEIMTGLKSQNENTNKVTLENGQTVEVIHAFNSQEHHDAVFCD